jgi:hypothetical protein
MKKNYSFLPEFYMYMLKATLLFFAACKEGKEEKKGPVPPAVAPAIYKKPGSAFSDTLIINTNAAVFFNPDSVQLQQIKAVKDSKDFVSDEHNCFYLMRNARIVLQKYWHSIQIIESSKARYLLFIKADKSRQCIDLDANGDMCGIYLFDRKKNPELADMMNIDTALEFYFHK